MKSQPKVSSLTSALQAVNDRWTLTLVRHLAFGPRRFTELARATGAPRDVLSSTLRSLVEAEIVAKQPYGTGVRSEYVLTRKGLDLAQVVLMLKQWGDRYRVPDSEVLELRHTLCGETFEAELHCAACGELLGVDELEEVHAD